MSKKSPSQNLSRRHFLGASADNATSIQFFTSSVLIQSPNEKLNLAFVGAGGRAEANISGCKSAGANIYALCDVDTKKSAKKVSENPQAKFYPDYREMLEKEGDNIDAVVVSTPDQTHAVAAMAALQMGKHV
ncbi:MAG: Gfo/Idh/MocA family oxidoreductase [Verrucomicrobiota bacterium]